MTLASLIVEQNSADSRGIVHDLAWRLLLAIEKVLLKFLSKHEAHHKLFNVSELGVGSVLLVGAVNARGAEGLAREQLHALDLDLLVDCGGGTLSNELRSCARLGAIGFSQGHNGMDPRSAAGFWECYYREPQTAIMIGQLHEQGRILPVFRGAFATRYWFSLNQAELARRQQLYLQDALKKIAETGRIAPWHERLWIDDRPACSKPSLGRLVGYAGKLLTRVLTKFARRGIGMQATWSISTVPGTLQHAPLRRARALPAPAGRFWADPMLCAREDKVFCFVEEYIFKSARGRISALEITDTGVIHRGVALEERFHLSFPFVFAHGSELLMCPEASEANQIRLYTCRDFPLGWELRAVIMDRVSAADTMLFPHQDRWWMLTNIDRSPSMDDHCYELHVFWASSPLSTDWRPHPNNPVKVDSFGARNAGMVRSNDKIYRFGQRQGFDRYGEGLIIHEITSLHEDDYREIEVQEVLPRFKPGLLGVHHLSSIQRCTVFDHLQWTIPWLARR